MPPVQRRERVDRLHDPRAGRPATAHSGRERDHADLPATDRAGPALDRVAGDALSGVDQVGVVHVADVGIDRQAVPGQADSSVLEVFAELRVLHRVEPVRAADHLGGLVPGRGGRVRGRVGDAEEVVHHRAKDAEQFVGFAAVVGEVVNVGLSQRVERVAPLGDHPGDLNRVVPRRHHRVVAGQQRGGRAHGIDAEVIDDRAHGEGQRVVERGLGLGHDVGDRRDEFGATVGRDEESHPAARHSAEHQEPPVVVAEPRFRPRDDRFGELVADPGDDLLERPFPILGREPADASHVVAAHRRDDVFEDVESMAARPPFAVAAQQVLGRHHVEDRPDVLGHPPVDQDKAGRQGIAEVGPGCGGVEQGVRGQQPPPAHAPFGVGRDGGDPFDQLHAGEDPPRVLPAAPRAAEPLAEDRPCHDQPRLDGFERAGQVLRLPRGAHQEADNRRQQVRRDRQPGPFRNVVDLAHDLQAVARPDDSRE